MANSWLHRIRNSLGRLLSRGAEKISVDPIGRGTGFGVGSATLSVTSPDLRPEKLPISTDDPYREDLLGREDFGEGLSRLIHFGSGTGVVLIDGGWGSGKSTFLKMWTQKTRNQGEVVAMVNAWHGDYRGNPLEYIAEQLVAELEKHILSKFMRMRRLGNRIRGFFARILPPILRIFRAGTEAAAPSDGGASWVATLALQELVQSLRDVMKRAPITAVGRLENLKQRLEQAAKSLRKNQNQLPRPRFVVVVDELDRCRPDYAVRFLETIKHVFGVRHVTFVVAANKTQLAHAISGVYGEEFDGDGYLERFFDITLRLPEGTHEAFVTKVVQDARLDSHFGRDIPKDELGDSLTAENILAYMLYHSTLSPREIHKTLKHIRIMLLLHRDRLADSALTAVVLAALRSVARDAYDALEHGEAGREAIDLLCKELGKNVTSGDLILVFIDDILYWCWQDAEQELRTGKRVRRKEPKPVEAGVPSEGNPQRSARKKLVDYRAARDAIELIATMQD